MSRLETADYKRKEGLVRVGISGISGFPGDSDGNRSTCNAGDQGSITVSRRSPGRGHGSPLQYSCLENSMVRGAWRATVHGVAKNQTSLSNYTFTSEIIYAYNKQA